MSTFQQFSFKSSVMKMIEQLNFTEPTQIQQQVIPKVLKGANVIGKSQTGSGKTHAFLLPIFQKLDRKNEGVQAVITAPTRELARQLYKEARKMIRYADQEKEWGISLLIGGTDRKRAAQSLQNERQIIVGTPGRILDLVKSNDLSIYTADTFVIDEADLMFDLGFLTEIDQLLVRMKDTVQVLAFSATIPVKLEHFFKKYLKQPLFINVDGDLPPTLEHRLIDRKNRDEADLIWEINKIFQPYLALIFTNGKDKADDLTKQLQEKGLSVGSLHGGLTPRERKRMKQAIEKLQYEYIVVTDLASRGIDIPGISHVINAQLPKEEHFYIHRVGRTARAGLEGMAISFYDESDIPLLERLENKGVSFQFVDVEDGVWKEARRWNHRAYRQHEQHLQQLEKKAWQHVKKPKRIKPGYKKKMKQEQERIAKQLRKQKKHTRRKK